MLLTTYLLVMIVQTSSGSVATMRVGPFPGLDACQQAAQSAKMPVPIQSAQIGFVCVPENEPNLPRR